MKNETISVCIPERATVDTRQSVIYMRLSQIRSASPLGYPRRAHFLPIAVQRSTMEARMVGIHHSCRPQHF